MLNLYNLSPIRSGKVKVTMKDISVSPTSSRAELLESSGSTSEGSPVLSGLSPLCIGEEELEAIADMLQEQLNNDGFVQDRNVKNKVCVQSFFGGDVVSLLQDLLLDKLENLKTKEVTRCQALSAGRQIQEAFGLFVHVHNPSLLLTDTQTDLFQFQNNLPMQVASVRKLYPSHWDRVNLLEQELSSASSTDAFTAQQAIDVLMEFKLVKSRKEGVQMMRRLNDKVHCCKLASSAHPFTDSVKFRDDDNVYVFVAPEHRLTEETSRRRTKKTLSLDIHGSSGDLESLKAKATAKKKMRKTKSSVEITPLLKDSNYFKERVGSLKSQLDLYRKEKFTAQKRNDTKNFVWNMGKAKREPDQKQPAAPLAVC